MKIFTSILKSPKFLPIFLVAFNLGVNVNVGHGFDAAQYYELKCSSCHTIGGGDDVGPDLKGVGERRKEEWLIRFIQESQNVIAEGDPVAVALFEKFKRKKMPDQELTAEDVKELLAFIKDGKGAGSTQTFKSAANATEVEIARGEKYFTGENPLSKGGPACIACHSAGSIGQLGGGKLGPNLTLAYSNYNDKGLSKVLTNISFPTMATIYKKHPLSEQEVYEIKSFLYSVDKVGELTSGETKKFIFMGLIGFLLLLGSFDLLWRARRKNTSRPKQHK